MKKLTLISSLFCGLLATHSAQATISIDSMVKFAEEGKASFKITNIVDYRQFIQLEISNISVKDGKLVETPYSKNNIADWRLTARPTLAMINPKMQKEFTVEYKAKNPAESEVDQTFQLTIVPVPYYQQDEKPQHGMQVAIGFAPYIIVPAKNDQPLAYDIERDQNKITIKNNGKTYISASINACPLNTKREDLKKCAKTINALAGRNIDFSLTGEFKKAKSIKINLSTHNAKFRDDFELSAGQKRKV